MAEGNAKPPHRIAHEPACPICGKNTNPPYAPFCGKRCADVDLHRWLSGSYTIADESDAADDVSGVEITNSVDSDE